jgi:hypothetical protein
MEGVNDVSDEGDAAGIRETRTKRFAFLHALYEEAGGDVSEAVLKQEVGDVLGFDSELVDRIVMYLAEEGLIVWVSQGYVALAHNGLMEVERAMLAPSQPTEHFPPFVVNYINVGTMTGSQIQQGTSGSTQTLEAGQLDAIRQVLADIRDLLSSIDLEEDAERELQSELATVEAQLASPRPKLGIVREALSSTRSILEGAAGGAAAPQLPALMHALTHLIASLPT